MNRPRFSSGGRWQWTARLALLAALMTATALLAAQSRLPSGDKQPRLGNTPRTGFLLKAYRSEPDGTQQPYALLVPRGYVADRPWPLLVALHGAFSEHVGNLRRVMGSNGALPDPPMVVLSPYGRGELMSYDGLGGQDVLRTIEEVRRDYNIDPDRIYLTGLSMGGGGTWLLGLQRPDLFAAIVPVCAVVDPRQWIDNGDRPLYDQAALERAMPTAFAENALNQKVFVFHGDADPVVPVSDSRRMVERFKALGWLDRSVRYFELPGVQHNAWDTAYKDGNIFRLLAGIRRPNFPARVWFKTSSLRNQKAYWARIDRIDSGRALAEIDARHDDSGGAFTVHVSNTSGFSLLVDATPLTAAIKISVRVRDGAGPERAVFEGPAGDSPISFSREGNRWGHVEKPVTGAPPEHALVGLASRSVPRQAAHIYVYGTDGPPAATAAARHLAEALANWGPGVPGHFPVIADREVTAQMLGRWNLVLVGDATINRLVRQLGPRLPIDANASTGERSYRLIVQDALAPGRPALVFGAQSPTALQRFMRFARANKDSWAPEPNFDYIQFDAMGGLEKTQLFLD